MDCAEDFLSVWTMFFAFFLKELHRKIVTTDERAKNIRVNKQTNKNTQHNTSRKRGSINADDFMSQDNERRISPKDSSCITSTIFCPQLVPFPHPTRSQTVRRPQALGSDSFPRFLLLRNRLHKRKCLVVLVVQCVRRRLHGKLSSRSLPLSYVSYLLCSAPAPAPTRAVAAPPPAAPMAAPAMAPAGRQPGLFAQMAATAGGVAVGSAVGHTIGAALTGMPSILREQQQCLYFGTHIGGSRGHDQQVAAEQPAGPNAQALYQNPAERYSNERCTLYQKEFMKCLDQAGGDSTQCQGFWEAMKVYLFRSSCIFTSTHAYLLSLSRNANVTKARQVRRSFFPELSFYLSSLLATL